MENLKGHKLKFFIAYERDTAHDIAIHLKQYLEKQKDLVEKAFVAPEDVPDGVENQEEHRFNKIKESDYFVLILTPRAWENSKALREEWEVAKKVQKENFILVVLFDVDEIPEELKSYQWVGGKIFKTPEEVARAFGKKLDHQNFISK